MSQFLFYYVRPEPQTWVFLSIFSILGVFVVFHRFWSMRNLDILLILSFTLGYMMVYEGNKAALSHGEVPLAASMATGSGLPPADANRPNGGEDPSLVGGAMVASEGGERPDAAWSPRSLLYWGFLSLLVCAGLLTTRMLLDTAIVRRPLLEPNLNGGGMLFIGISLLVFLLVNVGMSTKDENRK
jgi:hypothetical protein